MGPGGRTLLSVVTVVVDVTVGTGVLLNERDDKEDSLDEQIGSGEELVEDSGAGGDLGDEQTGAGEELVEDSGFREDLADEGGGVTGCPVVGCVAVAD